ncbi:MAG: response regulator [Candidatus Acidiferrales bacterium]
MLSRVLVVDDDPLVCELVKEVLDSVEMDAVTLTDSKEASTRLAQEKFQAVFLDVHMPRPGGIELAGQMRASGMNRSTPIVVITGEDDRSALTDAFNAGANFFLYKPIDRHRLLRLVRVAHAPIQREARRYQRVKVPCKLALVLNQERISGITVDLSLGGMFVQASRTLPVGSVVQVLLELKAGAHPLNLPARVVRTTGENSMGLQIENAGPEESKKLQEFLLPMILAKIE